MKYKASPFIAASVGLASLFTWQANAADVTWDLFGAGPSNGTITGGAGTWDTTITNWTTDGGTSNAAWVNANNDTAIFGGTAGTVTLGSALTANGITFNTTGYVLSGAQTITLAGTTPTINVGVTTATIGSTVSSTILAGSAGLTKTGSGQLLLIAGVNTPNTFTGGITVKGGQLALNFGGYTTGNNNMVATSNALTLNNGALSLLVGGNLTNSQTLASTSLTGGQSIIHMNKNGTGTGTLVLGAVTRSVGATASFQLSGSAANKNITSSTFTAAGTGTIRDSGVAYATFLTSGTSSASLPTGSADDWASWNGTSLVAATYTASTATTLSGNANIATGIDTTLSTAGTTTLTSLRNNLNQARTITLGASRILSTGGILIGSTVAGNTTTITGGTLRSAATAANKDLVIIANNTGNTAIDSLVANSSAGSTGLTKSGVGTVTLSNANTFTGSTILNGGTLSLTNSLALQNSAIDTEKSIAGTSTAGFKTNQTALTLGGLTGNKDLSSVFTTTSGGYSSVTALTLNPDTGVTHSYSGAITNGASDMSLTKSGGGTQVLSGTNTYSGGTLISGGTLTLDATGTIDNTSGVSLGTSGTFDVSAKSDYTVAALSGSGDVIGALTVSTTLAIGNSPGTINFSENLTLDSAAYVYEMTGGVSPGLGSADLGNVTGTITIVSGSTLDLVELGTYTVGNKFTLFSYTTGISGTFDGLANNGIFLDDLSNSWQIRYDDISAGLNGGSGSGFVTITAVPEPTAALLGSLGLLFVLRRRRNRVA